MSYSDDEEEFVPPTDITDYKFVNKDDEPVSFAELPLEHGNPSRQRVYLRGKTDNGLRSIYTEVTSWKLDLSFVNKPYLSVLCVDGNWVKLLKPIKAFEYTIKTVMVTVEFLHIVRWNYNILSKQNLWECVCKRFSMCDSKPSMEDLIEHESLIRETIEMDNTLAPTSKIISTFLTDKPRKRRDLEELVVENNIDNENHKFLDDGESGDGDYLGYVCSICDDGGVITQCEGMCMRSFHLTKEAGDDDGDCCPSLGFTKEQAEQIGNVAFYCKNCEYKQHQCSSCGELGSSDESSFGYVKVFRCIKGACGRFYHPDCVAKLLHPSDGVSAKDQSRHISSGEPFTCPAHKCDVCKGKELKSDKQLQFAVCRRCPRAYHRKCLPRDIAFEAVASKGRFQRAWDDVIPNRILIYCLDHDIDDDLLVPLRNHLKFPCQMDSSEGASYSVEDAVVEKASIRCSENMNKLSMEHNTVTLDDEARKSILSLMKDASASVTLEDIKERHAGEAPSTHDNSSKLNVTLGEVEVAVKATRAALEILDTGGCVQDAKDVCADDLLLRLGQWKEKLRENLAPFLYETCYTSSGCHTIKIDKLQEIVNMLHCYVQDGDTIVDLCCGSKDFSCLLKKKLIKLGKPCSFKNFDIVQSEYGFCYEKKDWMTVEPHELPDASRLIMFLNPPLGVNVALVNEFINKALTFKPKLLILIVQRETQRLDEKESPNDLIWEDDEMLAEKLCHLPGSDDKPIDDWKSKARVLYLWSNPDWTEKHNCVAELHGHPGTRKNRTAKEPKSIGENNGVSLNNHSDGNPKDSANNKRKVDMGKKAVAEKSTNKRPALNSPSWKLGPSKARQSKHLEQQSSHAHGKDHSEYNDLPSGDKGIPKVFEKQSLGQKKKNDSLKHSPKPNSSNRATAKQYRGYPSKWNPKDLKKNKSNREFAENQPNNRLALNPVLPKLTSEAHSSKHLERQSSRVQRKNGDPFTHVSKFDSGKRASTELPSEGIHKDSGKNKIGESDKKAVEQEKFPTKRPALNFPLSKLGSSEVYSSKHASQREGDKGTIEYQSYFLKLDCNIRASTERSTGYPSVGYPKDNKRKREVHLKAASETPLSRRPSLDPLSPKLFPSEAHFSKHRENQSTVVRSRKTSSDPYKALPVPKNHRPKNHEEPSDCTRPVMPPGGSLACRGWLDE